MNYPIPRSKGRKHRWRMTYFPFDPPFRQCKRCGQRQRLRLAKRRLLVLAEPTGPFTDTRGTFMLIVGLLMVTIFSAFFGWTLRGIVADKEHDYRWNRGCRHNIEENWRG